MTVSPLAVSAPTPSASRSATSPEEAAEQFEAVLTRQFVQVMTQDLFDEEGEGMLSGQADLQRDTLTDALTQHLTDAGTLGIADLLLTAWGESAPRDVAAAESPSPATAESGGTAPFRSREITMEEALRTYARAAQRPASLDSTQ